MRPPEQSNLKEQKSLTRSGRNSFFYFQREGQRFYLRFTPLGTTVLVLIIVVPVIALLILFYINSRSPEPQVNTNITVQPAAPFSVNTPIIRQAPPPSPAKAVKQPRIPPPPTITTPSNSANEQLAPKQTPQPRPSESPP